MKIVIVEDETSSLSLDEKKGIIESVVRAVGGCVPVEVSGSDPIPLPFNSVIKRVNAAVQRIEVLMERVSF